VHRLLGHLLFGQRIPTSAEAMSLLTGAPSHAELLDPGASYASMGSLIDDRSDEEGQLTAPTPCHNVPPLHSEAVTASGGLDSTTTFGIMFCFGSRDEGGTHSRVVGTDEAGSSTKRSMASTVAGEGLEITSDHLGMFWKTFLSTVIGVGTT
jgi:hypothetical protein